MEAMANGLGGERTFLPKGMNPPPPCIDEDQNIRNREQT